MFLHLRTKGEVLSPIVSGIITASNVSGVKMSQRNEKMNLNTGTDTVGVM